MGVADGLDGGGVDGREGEVPAGDTQVSGLSAWRVAVPFPEVGRPAGGGAGVGTQCGAGQVCGVCRSPRELLGGSARRSSNLGTCDESRQLALPSLTKCE